MATGGTIPSNRQQSVTFYNTTGVIEKNKNIYLAPRFSKENPAITVGTEVRSAYLSVFNRVCPPSSNYTAIEISSWSPQDRTLKVRGNVDDFRLVTEEGDCLNYFIITRTITKGEGQQATSKTFYYGFFITGVQQAGGGSVSLTIEPDDFTNVFYLHNTHQLTALEISNDYEPFNEKLKNCYVNRQHYNRVKYEQQYVETDIVSNNETIEVTSSTTTEITFQMVSTYRIVESSLTPHYSLISGGGALVMTIIRVLGKNVTVRIVSAGSGTFSVWCSGKELTPSGQILVPDNTKIFLNQEESFRFKYQYRDDKYPVSTYNGLFTEQEKESIKNAETLSDLGATLRSKVIKSSISYLVIETKSTKILSKYHCSKLSSDKSSTYTLINANRIRNEMSRPNPVICIPFISPLPQLEHISFSDLIIMFSKETYTDYANLQSPTDINELFRKINDNSTPDFLYNCYIVRDVLLPESVIDISYNGLTQKYNLRFLIDIPDFENMTPVLNQTANVKVAHGVYLVGLGQDENTRGEIGMVYSAGDTTSFYSFGGTTGIPALLISGKYDRTFNLSISENLPNLKQNYYEEVLETEPYSFYSVSYYSAFELTFNKNRYYSGLTSNIKLQYFCSVNGGIKLGFIPVYTVEEKEYPYFNEGLSFVLNSALPLVSDSYSTFYYQNQAQMKNQFAVNDYNRGVDLQQHFFISGPNAVGMAASRGGGYSALAQTGNQVMEMIDEGIDWAQSNKVIEMNQKSKLADMGARPDVLKQAGSDIIYDLLTREDGLFFNHYTIDELSYNSIAKMLERTGYQVNLYDTLNTMDRVGWNFVKLNMFDFNTNANIMVSQENSIRRILSEGVTLLHDKTYLTSGHNYETILEGGE